MNQRRAAAEVQRLANEHKRAVVEAQRLTKDENQMDGTKGISVADAHRRYETRAHRNSVVQGLADAHRTAAEDALRLSEAYINATHGAAVADAGVLAVPHGLAEAQPGLDAEAYVQAAT